jgi:hypothetical protein
VVLASADTLGRWLLIFFEAIKRVNHVNWC